MPQPARPARFNSIRPPTCVVACGLRLVLALGAVFGILFPARAQPLQFPTANRALLTPGQEEQFYVGTTGKPWTSGMYGCVRSSGSQFHEGLDIRCLERDRRGEPTDAVRATADGTVVYCNRRPSLSNYGNYVVIRHAVDGVDLYSLYAHLGAIRTDLKPGVSVRAGESFATMGRTTNTRESITRDRAHLHFELCLMLSDRFPTWFRKTYPKERNDHGLWNGQNLLGIDPALVFQRQAKEGKNFSLRRLIQSDTELCRVLVRDNDLPYARRYPALVEDNVTAQKAGVAGYELVLNYVGLPIRLIPRAESELRSKSRIQLLSVNAAEAVDDHCRKLVSRRGSSWGLAYNGSQLMDLLTQ
jgi:hypothetical protein